MNENVGKSALKNHYLCNYELYRMEQWTVKPAGMFSDYALLASFASPKGVNHSQPWRKSSWE